MGSSKVLDELMFKGVVAGISSSHHEFLIAKGGLLTKPCYLNSFSIMYASWRLPYKIQKN